MEVAVVTVADETEGHHTSRVQIPMLTNTKAINAGDRLYCKSAIGIPCNLDTGEALRATLVVPSESAASSSRPTGISVERPGDVPDDGYYSLVWPKRRRID